MLFQLFIFFLSFPLIFSFHQVADLFTFSLIEPKYQTTFSQLKAGKPYFTSLSVFQSKHLKVKTMVSFFFEEERQSQSLFKPLFSLYMIQENLLSATSSLSDDEEEETWRL